MTGCWRRQWHPTPVLLSGKSHGWRSLVGCSSWGRKESDTTERLSAAAAAVTGCRESEEDENKEKAIGFDPSVVIKREFFVPGKDIHG